MSSSLHNLFDSPHLTDILIEFENILDTLDVYLYKYWFDGYVLKGPVIRKYFIEVWLRYEVLPDPKAAKRMTKHGILVELEPVKEKEKNKPWIVKIQVPKHLFGNLALSNFQDYDDEVDLEDVQDAIDAGLDTEQYGGQSNV